MFRIRWCSLHIQSYTIQCGSKCLNEKEIKSGIQILSHTVPFSYSVAAGTTGYHIGLYKYRTFPSWQEILSLTV